MNKINLKVRIKNPYFWLGIISALLVAINISPEMITSWSIMKDNIIAVLQNPYKLGCAIIALVSYIVDHTTKGFSDSERVMSYTKPN